MTRRYLALLLCLMTSLVITSSLPGVSFAARPGEIAPVTDMTKEPAAYIVVDAAKGKIISSKNIHEARGVASTSKIVTALAAINTIDADQLIDIPLEAESVQPMKIGMKQGQKWNRDDLLYSLLLVSANDAAYALADASTGSISSFTKQQTRIGKELGMKDSTFGDPSGLDDEAAINGGTKMSVYDLAIAGRALLAQPFLAKIVRTPSYQFVGGDNIMHTLTNHNDKFLKGYAGANGLKTGYTQRAGRTLMVSATRNDTTLIAVVVDVQQTNEWAAQLLNQGFADIEAGKVSKKAATLPAIGVIGSLANITILKEPQKNEKATASKIGSTQVNAPSERNEFLSVPLVSLILLAILTFLFLWRRRNVKKRKRLRRERALALKESQRRAMIDVIDLTIEAESELVSKG